MLHGIDIVDTGTFYLCELILCVSEGMHVAWKSQCGHGNF